MAQDKWSEKGITFKIPTLEDFDKIREFMYQYFFPDEPIFGSTKLMEGNGFVDRQVQKIIEDHMIRESLKDKTSLIATDYKGDIIGCRYLRQSILYY